jgi:CO/xanthine dehydrogenase FAD-binding subunit
MIIEYHRPGSMADAIALLARKTPKTLPLAGGTDISHRRREQFAVVDLQGLGLNKISGNSKKITIGAMATIQQIVENPKIPEDMRRIAQLEAGKNLRNMGTLGGCIMTGDGRSMIIATLLCLDAILFIEPGSKKMIFRECLEQRKRLKESVITTVELDNRPIKFACIRKTPKDLPLLSVFLTSLQNKELRVAIGGRCSIPSLLNPSDKFPQSLDKIYNQYEYKEISKEYFCTVVPILIERLKEELK